MIKKLPKRIIDEPNGRVFDLEFEIQKQEGGLRYLIMYINRAWRECAFLVSSYEGFDYETMLKQLNEDIHWQRAK
jgi:hypothetical protein